MKRPVEGVVKGEADVKKGEADVKDEQAVSEDEETLSARKRREGRHQIEGRREAIITAATELFLAEGLESTTMTRIAEGAGITTVTLYRYFPDRHPIAFEVAARMIDRIATVAGAAARQQGPAHSAHAASGSASERFRRICLAMVDEFDTLRDAYRFIGLFDHLYAGSYPSEELASWYKDRLQAAVEGILAGDRKDTSRQEKDGSAHIRRVTVINSIMSFLEKMSARGELMAAEQDAPLAEQLHAFRGFLERILDDESY